MNIIISNTTKTTATVYGLMSKTEPPVLIDIRSSLSDLWANHQDGIPVKLTVKEIK